MLRKYENKFDKCGKIKSLKSAHFPHKILQNSFNRHGKFQIEFNPSQANRVLIYNL